jgi:DNA polymerase-3 subunit alpha
VPPATKQQKLLWEKELLGIYLSEHPFAQAAEKLGTLLTCSIVELNTEFAGRDTIIGGMVTGTRSLTTKDGRVFIAAELEDLTGSIEVTVWPETYEATRDIWKEGTIIVASVRIRENNDRLQVAVNRASAWSESFDPQALLSVDLPANGNGAFRRGGGPRQKNGSSNGNGASSAKVRAPPAYLRIVLEETDDPESDEERLRTVMQAIRDYSGEDPVRLEIREVNGSAHDLDLPPARRCPELTHRLSEILGPWGSVVA